MLRSRKLVVQTYKASKELAINWPTIVASAGYHINYDKAWAKKAAEITGFPWGEVSTPNGRISVGVHVHEAQEPSRFTHGMPGPYIHLTFQRRYRLVVDEVGELLIGSGAEFTKEVQV